MIDSILISSIIISSSALLYKIIVICYASKCKIFKFNCQDGITVERDTQNEQSIRHLNDVEVKVTP
jgi:hypothetical protein